MFKARNIDVPEGCADCASCGCHGNDLRAISTYMSTKIGGKLVTNKAQASEITLCRDCRRELMILLWELDDEDTAGLDG